MPSMVPQVIEMEVEVEDQWAAAAPVADGEDHHWHATDGATPEAAALAFFQNYPEATECVVTTFIYIPEPEDAIEAEDIIDIVNNRDDFAKIEGGYFEPGSVTEEVKEKLTEAIRKAFTKWLDENQTRRTDRPFLCSADDIRTVTLDEAQAYFEAQEEEEDEEE